MALQMKEITDPDVLKRLNSGQYEKSTEITDPDLLKRLNAGEFGNNRNITKKPSVVEDIIQSIAKTPGELIGTAVELPSQILESVGQISHHPLRATGNIETLQGYGQSAAQRRGLEQEAQKSVELAYEPTIAGKTTFAKEKAQEDVKAQEQSLKINAQVGNLSNVLSQFENHPGLS